MIEKEVKVIEVKEITEQHPWKRYFARYIDYIVMVLIPIVILVLIFPTIEPDMYSVLCVVWCVFYIFVEMLLLHFYSTTLGKKIFGIYVKDLDGNNLDMGEAFGRAFFVNIFVYIISFFPFISIIAYLFCYFKLMEEGTTWWDDSAKSMVIYK